MGRDEIFFPPFTRFFQCLTPSCSQRNCIGRHGDCFQSFRFEFSQSTDNVDDVLPDQRFSAGQSNFVDSHLLNKKLTQTKDFTRLQQTGVGCQWDSFFRHTVLTWQSGQELRSTIGNWFKFD